MAAHVIAKRIDLDVYRIDLSQVVNKYIGETEKNYAGWLWGLSLGRRLFSVPDYAGVTPHSI